MLLRLVKGRHIIFVASLYSLQETKRLAFMSGESFCFLYLTGLRHINLNSHRALTECSPKSKI